MGGLREMSQRATQQTEGRGLSPAYLSRIERGDTAPPRRPVLKLMADLLGVSEMRLDLIAQGWMLLEIKSVLEVQGEQRLLEKGDRIAGLGVALDTPLFLTRGSAALRAFHDLSNVIDGLETRDAQGRIVVTLDDLEQALARLKSKGLEGKLEARAGECVLAVREQE